MKKALLFGASGFVGSHLLQELLSNPDYGLVTAVARRELGLEHPKLKTVIGDLDSLAGLGDEIAADDVFIAIGTTKKKTPDKTEYYRIDHDYPVTAARVARERGASSLFLVSAIGADSNSGVYYSRIKGDAERNVIALGYGCTHIFRPSIIMGERPEQRPLEKVLIALCGVINPLLGGGLKKYRGLEAAKIARAMNNAAKTQGSDEDDRKVKIYGWQEMTALQ